MRQPTEQSEASIVAKQAKRVQATASSARIRVFEMRPIRSSSHSCCSKHHSRMLRSPLTCAQPHGNGNAAFTVRPKCIKLRDVHWSIPHALVSQMLRLTAIVPRGVAESATRSVWTQPRAPSTVNFVSVQRYIDQEFPQDNYPASNHAQAFSCATLSLPHGAFKSRECRQRSVT
jgi:hypothetical protein